MNLSKISTRAPKGLDKKKIKKKTEELHCELRELHKVMRAEEKHAVLGVFQGMDASGKDGSVCSLYQGLFPMAAYVHAYKAPTEFEASLDFLSRIHHSVPSKGYVGLFNRSQYEDILVPTVHKLFDESSVKARYGYINQFENLLEGTGTKVLKFYLHISKGEQKERFKERFTTLEKKWKYNSNDLAESKLWDKYMDVYEHIFKKSEIEWTIVPADDKWYRDYLIAKKFVHEMKSMKMKYPTTLR